MIVCVKCGVPKGLHEFYANDKSCKECRRILVRANRAKNADYYRDYDKNRGARKTSEQCKSTREKYPNQYKAQNAVNNALRDGRLVKGCCEYCGSLNVHAHHNDYLKPPSNSLAVPTSS